MNAPSPIMMNTDAGPVPAQYQQPAIAPESVIDASSAAVPPAMSVPVFLPPPIVPPDPPDRSDDDDVPSPPHSPPPPPPPPPPAPRVTAAVPAPVSTTIPVQDGTRAGDEEVAAVVCHSMGVPRFSLRVHHAAIPPDTLARRFFVSTNVAVVESVTAHVRDFRLYRNVGITLNPSGVRLVSIVIRHDPDTTIRAAGAVAALAAIAAPVLGPSLYTFCASLAGARSMADLVSLASGPRRIEEKRLVYAPAILSTVLAEYVPTATDPYAACHAIALRAGTLNIPSAECEAVTYGTSLIAVEMLARRYDFIAPPAQDFFGRATRAARREGVLMRLAQGLVRCFSLRPAGPPVIPYSLQMLLLAAAGLCFRGCLTLLYPVSPLFALIPTTLIQYATAYISGSLATYLRRILLRLPAWAPSFAAGVLRM